MNKKYRTIRKRFSGWGNYPIMDSVLYRFREIKPLKQFVSETDQIIARGNARSYGDSSLNEKMIDMKNQHYFLSFNKKSGVLHLEAGALLADIVESFVPRGWFLKVTSGTKLITVGGAIASDVHGKNHHIEGCFSQSVQMFHLLLADGKVVRCSADENADLFKATCGGMGLTGIILDAKIQLIPIKSAFIQQTTIKNNNLKETFDSFEKYKESPYSVAWIDCLAPDSKRGRGLFMAGEFSKAHNLRVNSPKKLNIPFYFPTFILNQWTIKAFNYLYYKRVKTLVSKQKVSIDQFFYPLDSIGHWNRIYGKKGFIQYQCIFPKSTSFEAIDEILTLTSHANKGAFLAVLKLHGAANDNLLSFPLEGYSLALDFKMDEDILALLEQLDQIVVKYHGRIYLAKDSRMSKITFEKCYPDFNQFKKIREKYHMKSKFNSHQSKRLGL